jgi:hypothetical protein
MQKQVKIKQESSERSLKVESRGFNMKALSRAEEKTSGDESSGERNSQYSEMHADETGYNAFILSESDFMVDIKSDGGNQDQCDYEDYSHERSRTGKKKRKEGVQREYVGGAKQVQTEIKEEAQSSSDQEEQGRYLSFVFTENLRLEIYVLLSSDSSSVKKRYGQLAPTVFQDIISAMGLAPWLLFTIIFLH